PGSTTTVGGETTAVGGETAIPAADADFDQAFESGTTEVIEHAEEPVVQKEARVVEEVVLTKGATERPQTVRDTVRRTEVEVEPVEVGPAAGSTDFTNFEPDFRTNYLS